MPGHGNESFPSTDPRYSRPRPQGYPMEYQVLATILHIAIFVVGVLGNVAVVLVVRRTKSLYTPTYCYLASDFNFL